MQVEALATSGITKKRSGFRNVDDKLVLEAFRFAKQVKAVGIVFMAPEHAQPIDPKQFIWQTHHDVAFGFFECFLKQWREATSVLNYIKQKHHVPWAFFLHKTFDFIGLDVADMGIVGGLLIDAGIHNVESLIAAAWGEVLAHDSIPAANIQQ